MQAALWVVAAAAVGMATFPSWSALLVSRQAASISADAETVVLAVSGMTCTACATGIEKALGELPGVQAVSVDYDAGEAIVYVDPGGVPTSRLLEAVQAAGSYTAQVKRAG